MPMSAVNFGIRVPSTTVPPRIARSNSDMVPSDAGGAPVDDLVEIFRHADRRGAVAGIAREALGDARVQPAAVGELAPVAQRDQREHLALDRVVDSARARLEAQAPLMAVRVPLGRDLAF